MADWPVWFEGKELCAHDLVAMERYLLQRGGMVWGECGGIDRFDLSSSIKLEKDLAVIEIVCTDLAGISTGGHAVILKEDSLSFRGFVGELREDAFHLWIEINPRVDDADNRVKWLLVASSTRTPEGDHLSLGQMRWDNGRFSYIVRPRVRSLAALQPFDEAWNAWVRPLQEAFHSLLEGAENLPSPLSLSATTYVTDLARLSCEWVVLPIPELQRRIHVLRTLGARNRITDGFKPELLYSQMTYPLTELFSPEQWPQQLAETLITGEKPVAPTPVPDSGLGTILGAHQAILGIKDKSVLAEFLADFTGKTVLLIVALDCQPPQQIEFMTVSKDPVTAELSVVAAGNLQGTVRAGQMTYGLTPAPLAGHKVRFRSFPNIVGADKVKLAFVSEKVMA